MIDRRIKKVTVQFGEIQKDFWIRSLTERELQDLIRIVDTKKAEFNARLIAACVCNEEGQVAHSLQEVLEWDAAITVRLARICSQHVGVTEEAIEEAEKN